MILRIAKIITILVSFDVAYRTAPVQIPGSRAWVRKDLGIEV